MLPHDFFHIYFVFPILNLLVGFYHVFLFLKLPGALGFAILALTIFIRLLVHPFFDKQMQTAKKMQEIKPHLDHLSKKHKKDPKKLQQEQMRLYQEAGINPASGCLFMVIQIPIFIGLYNTLSSFLVHGTGAKVVEEINKVLYFSWLKINTIDPWFLGFNLALSPAKSGVWYYYLIPLVTGYLQYLQTKAGLFTSATPNPVASSDTENTDNKDDKKADAGDFQKAMNTQMKYLFPIMIAWFSYTLPVGLSLYWNIFSIFSILQYRRMNAKPAVKKLDSKEQK